MVSDFPPRTLPLSALEAEAEGWKFSGGFVFNWDLRQKVAGRHSYLSYFSFAEWIFFFLP